MKTKKVKAAGRFGSRYGTLVRKRITLIEAKQRKKQKCPYCSRLGVKRLSKGIWHCLRCGKKFASAAYYLNK
ncbi:50S ribosomal protein L37ae [Candidatus Pacearchaeota archaeon]|nr:50S ribosomal protein L37ae [Candidatus Pacearchaeota archaeon]